MESSRLVGLLLGVGASALGCGGSIGGAQFDDSPDVVSLGDAGDVGVDVGADAAGSDVASDTAPPPDPNRDDDGDGYRAADDCDDHDPLVNPGAFDVPGDGIDNDCNGTRDDGGKPCDAALALATADAMDFARALGLCQLADPSATGKAKRWGVVAAKLMTTDGVGAPMARQYGVQTSWGAAVTPREGAAMAVLSTSSARLPTQADYVKPLQFVDSTPNANAPPAGWPKNTVGCPAPMVATANDSVVLQLQIRVPTNARSFSYDLDFYTAEYLDYVCSGFNDTYVALLKSGAPLDPARSGNVSFDASGEPINVNSSFLQVCTPGTQNGKSFACPLGTSELAGTGFSGDGVQDGATSWLRTTASVLPGETITLSFMIWNTGDHWVGSTIVLDDFRWSATSVAAPTTGRPPL